MGTIERIQQAKQELVEKLPADGVAVLNGDDPLVSEMAGALRGIASRTIALACLIMAAFNRVPAQKVAGTIGECTFGVPRE